jgi:hypothetical protein
LIEWVSGSKGLGITGMPDKENLGKEKARESFNFGGLPSYNNLPWNV